MTTLQKIQEIFQKALEENVLWETVDAWFKVEKFGDTEGEKFKVTVEYPRDPEHGDYATNVAMQLAKPLGKSPREVAGIIVESLMKVDEASNIIDGIPEIAGPGFINIRVTKKVLEKTISDAVSKGEKFGHCERLGGQRIMVEFAHPNTHKAFHIGHLRTLSLGESIVRILESQGANVFRANYQGDVGPHVAKCIWGMMNLPASAGETVSSEVEARALEASTLTTIQRKVEYLGAAYAVGGKAYESDKDKTKGIQDEIKVINKKIYDKDPEITALWKVTRQWSLDYFDSVYKRLGAHFDRLFFESEMYERGTEIVKKHLKGAGGKDIFEESDGAIVFKGEEYGLHTRVFLTSEGNATYEGKDMANVEAQYATWNFDKIIHIVANPQAGYFHVVFKAIELVDPKFEGKQGHVDYGMVNLSSGKMSSRTGDVVTADSLIDDAKSRVEKVLEESNSDLSDAEKAEIAEKVAIGAVKFTILHADSKRDIAFDMERSLQLTGDSGPYLQYGYTRIISILGKVAEAGNDPVIPDYTDFNNLDWTLAKRLLRFEEEVTKSADEYTTHNTAHYLVGLVSDFSRWYENNRVADVKAGLRSARLDLLKAVKNVIANGLSLLGIDTVEKM